MQIPTHRNVVHPKPAFSFPNEIELDLVSQQVVVFRYQVCVVETWRAYQKSHKQNLNW